MEGESFLLFTSCSFLGFLAVLLLVYYLAPRSWQWPILLIASYIFYAASGLGNLVYILVTTLTTYFTGRAMGRSLAGQKAYLRAHKEELTREERKRYQAERKRCRRRWLIGCLLVNLGILAVLKYTGFVLSNVNALLSLFGSSAAITFLDLALPMGISFYTFQAMGYLIDVYRGTVEYEQNPFRLGLFVCFFPLLVQGPICRYGELSKTLYSPHPFDGRTLGLGLQRALWGYFKKLVVADRLMGVVRTLSGSPEEYQGVYVLVLMVVYAVTLYADFTGGIDVTIGAAQALGVDLPENFIRPFFSKNTAEYWRRWHITMGAWFRDYIFYPLSTSKAMTRLTRFTRTRLGDKAARRAPVYLSTIILWFVTGLWHGASWNFIVWGLLNGAIILVSQELAPLYNRFHQRFPGLRNTFGCRLFQVCRTFLLMSAVRVLDCYRDVPVTFRAVGTIFARFHPSILWDGSLLNLGITGWDWLAAGCGALLMLLVSLWSRDRSLRAKLEEKPLALRWLIFGALFLAVVVFGAYGVGYDQNQFIYNQF